MAQLVERVVGRSTNRKVLGSIAGSSCPCVEVSLGKTRSCLMAPYNGCFVTLKQKEFHCMLVCVCDRIKRFRKMLCEYTHQQIDAVTWRF